jgi:threonine aldolase
VRKILGGGMRQAGVIAAAGLVALRKGPERLPEDHENASRLAHALAELPGVALDPSAVRTNIVIARLTPDLFGGTLTSPDRTGALLERLAAEGVLGSWVTRERVRFVTHRDVSRAQVDAAIAAIRALLGGRTAVSRPAAAGARPSP